MTLGNTTSSHKREKCNGIVEWQHVGKEVGNENIK